MVLYIGNIVKKYKFLMFLGKNSIVVYGIHFSVLNIVIFVLSSVFIPQNHLEGFAFYCIVGVVTLLVSYCFCLFFQKKPFACLIGKF